MVTFGFYDSINHDRRYSAIQFGSIFDGILKDGIFMSIGAHFQVISTEGMMILIGTGRAWFNHTWTLNDAPLPMTIPQSEVLLDRIDAVVLDINGEQESRTNDIIIIKGTPSKTPQRPTLINTTNRHQYPLAYISVKAGVTSIRQSDVTNMIGTSDTPFVTGILETVNIDALITQWEDQWKEYNEIWQKEWETWYEAQTKEIQDAYLDWQKEWETWMTDYETMMNETAEEWKSLWNAWFYSYINENQQAIAEWQKEKDTEFNSWFESLQVILDGDVASNLARRVVELEACCGTVKEFMNNLTTEHAIYDTLYDYNNEPVLDSNGEQIGSKVIFVTK